MIFRRSLPRVLGGLVLLLGLAAARPVDPARGLVLENEFARFEFEPVGMGLRALIDRHSGANHIPDTADKHLLWEVAFGRGTQIQRITNNYKPCNHAEVETLANGTRRATLEWNGLRWWLEDRVVTVRVTVDLPKDSGIALWRIAVDNASDYWGLWTVAFPLVSGLPAAGQYDLARPVFASGGQLLRKCTAKIEARYPSGGWPMQFLALSRGADSVYLAGMDPDARAKDFVVDPGQRLAIVHYVENMGVAGSDYPDYYPVALGVYQGGWLEAAQRYREWALRQKWAQAGPLSQRADVPDSIKNVGLWVQENWVWNKAEGSPQQMDAPLIDAQKRMGVPMALHWYNWHHMRFDNQYPHFLPAKDGFRERVRELTGLGLLVMPYINGSSADMNIPDFERFAPSAIRDEAGGLRQHFYSDAAGRLLSMCPSQGLWQSTISALVDRLIGEEGVNAVYVDQVSAMQHELCFNPRHGHPLGGGRYWAAGNRDLLRKVRLNARREGRQAVITSEGADEVFLDLLDANLTWAQPSEAEIPLMEVVYSGYTIFFGSPCDFAGRSLRFFRYAQGQALIDGRQNGWMGLALFQPEHAAEADYLRECGRLRVAAKKYLTYGRLLRPIEPLQPVPTFTEDGFGWHNPHRATVPGAEARLWRAEDGTRAVFLANYLDETVPFTFRLDGKERTETLEPAQIRMLEIGKWGQARISPLLRNARLSPILPHAESDPTE